MMSPFRFHITSAGITIATGLRGWWRRRWAHGGWTRRSPRRRTRRRGHEWRRCNRRGGDSKVFGIRHIRRGRCRGDIRHCGLHSDVGSATNWVLIVPKLCIWTALLNSEQQCLLFSRRVAGGLQVLDPYAGQHRHWNRAHNRAYISTPEFLRKIVISYNVTELQKWVWTVSSRCLIIRLSYRIHTNTYIHTQHMTDLRSGIMWEWNWNCSFDAL